MNEKLARMREKLKGFWNQYSKTQKWVLASTAGFLIIAIILLTYLFTRTEYELAFQNLDSTDSQAIMDYLDSSGIPYKLQNGGTSISVPSADAARVKVAVGSQGLVQNGSIGFSELSKNSSSIGTTDQEFNVKYRNALNGEVQQLLQGMQGIQRAKVLVNLPQESVFLSDEDKERASASVQLTFKPGFRPKQEEIDSYFNLVKTAVPNLNVDDITITSQSSQLTPSSEVGGSGGAVSGTLLDQQFEIQRKFENGIKTKTEQFLSTMVGMDKMVVSVVSSLNFDQKTQQESIVKPLDNNDNKGIVISEQNSAESYTGSDSSTGGVAGVGQTDIANYPSSGGSSGSSSEKTSSTTNYEPSRIQTSTTFAPYQVKDLSISVAVDSATMTPEKQQAIQQKLVNDVRTLLADSGQNLPDDELAKRVSVISESFDVGTSGSGGFSASSSSIAIGAIAALALLGGGGYLLYRRRKKAREEAELAAAELPRVETPTIDIDSVSNENQVRKQLEGLAKRKPDEFVNLLRTWLVDE
ncbi:flagellar basal-body MS-ring/collar protein FliF [Cohnella sp. AR92]|uniref:flagellar basal-body MS-ring/collar protein FliF n=1 Tax=Cohnella sp. AR92 TaxID=648716 RepID=UPI000F8D718A|nr:flagellar basal-body MS-ring/collar protein FliF [Cohnella sp. AR92]RUS46376.1 flagellar M-ring protein FliF [Cohnella sp. AR92]